MKISNRLEKMGGGVWLALYNILLSLFSVSIALEDMYTVYSVF